MDQPPNQRDQDLDDLIQDSVLLLQTAKDDIGVPELSMKKVAPNRFMQLNKDKLCALLCNSLNRLEDFTSVTSTDFRVAVDCVKHEVMESQKTIIKLQSELLDCKNTQLVSLQSSVKTSVGESVKAEFESYSAALQSTSVPAAVSEPVSSDTIKQVVQTVYQEEDRSKNLIIFGLPEQQNEDLSELVNEVFQEIGVKPRVESCRVGRRRSGNTIRPVQVTAASSTTVTQILSKSRKLRSSTKFKTVFINPDRSLEQRAKQRELVNNVKKLKTEQPAKIHFIRNATIISIDKAKTDKTVK